MAQALTGRSSQCLLLSVAVPVSADKKRDLVVFYLTRRDPIGFTAVRVGSHFPARPGLRANPIFALVCSESVAPIGRGTAGVGPALKDTPVGNLLYTFHGTYFPLFNILVLLADLLHSGVRFG